jgi:polar amino acid transport system substrate-binding protein
VQQAVGCNKPAAEGAKYLAAFVENAKKSGLVASLIERHRVKGLSVAPLA